MRKKYKRKRFGWMRRTSRIYLNSVNSSKKNQLKCFLVNYSNALNYSIIRLWSCGTFSNNKAYKQFTDAIQYRFHTTARLAQCITKQAQETVNSQKKLLSCKRRMPRVKSHVAHLDSRFVDINEFHGSFDMCLKFASGVPKIIAPFNYTKHIQKFIASGWLLGNSIRLGYNKQRVFVDLIFEKEPPRKRTTGVIVGIDRGLNSMLFTSDGQDIGGGLKNRIKSIGKRRKSYHHYITTEENRLLKTLNLTDVKTIVLENLKYVKHGKRGKFSRNMNRLLSFWHYAKVGKRISQICEELGVNIEYKNPAYTSQRCPACGNIDRRNREGKIFMCLKCDFADDADYIGALNLEALGLAGVYSLRSLPNKFKGEYYVC